MMPRKEAEVESPARDEAEQPAEGEPVAAVATPDAASSGSAHSKTEPMIVFAYDCLRREFQSLRSHQPAQGTLPDADSIHQMRIAARRIRVALKLFKDMLPEDAVKRFNREFRWFARALGSVRDLDVYTENFREYLQAGSGGDATAGAHVHELGGYELSLRRARSQARNNLGEVFGGERFATLLTSFEALLAGAPSPGALRRWRSFRICDGAPPYLEAEIKRLLKRGRKVDCHAPAERLHRLRIEAKRLRYDLEFFAELYPALGKAAKSAKRLQDLLGEFQDACTATERLRAYARGLRSSDPTDAPGAARAGISQVPALERLMRNQQERAQEVRGRFAPAWRRFEKSMKPDKIATLLAS
jgi:CHAD domain-containing protein